MHQCTSAHLYGEASVRPVLGVTCLSRGRGGSVNPQKTARELHKTVTNTELHSQRATCMVIVF